MNDIVRKALQIGRSNLGLSLFATGLRSIGGLSVVVVSVLVLFRLSTSEAAIYFLATAVTRFVTTIITFGTENGIIGAVSAAAGKDSQSLPSLAKSLVRQVQKELAPRWAITIAVGCLLYVGNVAWLANHLLEACGLGLIGAPPLAWLRLRSRALFAAHLTVRGTAAENAISQVILLAAVWLSGAFIAEGVWVVALQTGAALVAGVIAFLMLRHQPAAPAAQVAKMVTHVHRHQRDMTIINITDGVQEQFDIFLLGLVSAPAAVNSYAVAKRVSSPILLLTAGVSSHFAPRLALSHHQDGAESATTAFRSLIRSQLALATGLAVAYVTFILMWGDRLSNGSQDFITIALIVGAAQVINLACGPAAMLLQLTNRATVVRQWSIYTGAFQVAATLLFGYLADGIGAAIAMSIAMVGRNVALLWVLLRRNSDGIAAQAAES